MKLFLIILLVSIITSFSYSDNQDSFLGNIKKIKKKHPEIFNPGVYKINKDGKEFIVYCGYSERYFEDNSIENEQELWEEAEIDAKERLLSFFTKANECYIEISIENNASLFHWIKQKSLYYRNFVISKENLIIKKKQIIDVEFQHKKTITNPENNKIIKDFKKEDTIKNLNQIYLQAKKNFYINNYCISAKQYIKFENKGGILPEISKRNKKFAKLFCKLFKKKNNKEIIIKIADLFYFEKNYHKSYQYYKKFTNIIFNKDNWLKNVPADILYKYGVSSLELNLDLKAKNLFRSIRQFYPLSKYLQYAKEKMNDL